MVQDRAEVSGTPHAVAAAESAQRSLSTLMAGRAVSALLGVGVLAMTLRSAGTTAYGEYLVLLAVLEIHYLVTGVGLSSVVQREVPNWRWQGLHASDLAPLPGWGETLTDRLWRLVALRAVLGALGAGLLALMLTAAPPAWNRWAAGDVTQLAVLWFGLGCAWRMTEELLTALQMQDLLQGSLVGLQGLRLWVLATLISPGEDALRELVVLDASCAAVGTVAALGMALLRLRRTDTAPGAAATKPVTGSDWRTRLGFWGVQLLGLGMGAPAQRLVVAPLGGAEAVATLGVAMAVMDTLRSILPLSALGNWLRPVLIRSHLDASRTSSVHPQHEATLLTGALIKSSWWALAGCMVVLTWWGDTLMRAVSGRDTANAAMPSVALMLTLCGVLGIQQIRLGLGLLNQLAIAPRRALMATLLACTALPTTAVLWPVMGLWAVPVAMALGEALWALVVGAGLRSQGFPVGLRWAAGAWTPAQRRLVGSITPQALRRLWRRCASAVQLVAAYAQDTLSFMRGSGLMERYRPGEVQAHLLMQAHRLDKGMALAMPRPGFGEDARQRILQLSALHTPSWTREAAWATLQRHERLRHDVQGCGEPVQTRPQAAGGTCSPSDPSLIFTAQQTRQWAQGPFEALLKARRSVRQFAPDPIDPSLIAQAVEWAGRSPSVCNRSGSRVWVSRDPMRMRQLLQAQNGNRGFGDQIGALLVVTVRPDVFHTVGERHQGWIDGGLFAMTLIHGLVRLGLGTCCLNWCVTPRQDRRFKRLAGIPRDEMVVMMVAVGHLRERYTVAHSPRRPLDELLHDLDAGLQGKALPCASA